MAKLTQEELLEIYNAVYKMMKPFEKANIHPRIDIQGKYDMWVDKEVEVQGKKKDEMYLGGLILQSNYVGFYYMPVYVDPSLKEELAPELVKTLKGKSCFHIKKANKDMLGYIKDAMKKGVAMYKERGWY